MARFSNVTRAAGCGAALAVVVGLGAGCGAADSGGLCELKAHAEQPARIQVTNHLDHAIGWRIVGDSAFSQQQPGECAQIGAAAGAFSIDVVNCSNPDCNSPDLGDKVVSGTVAAGATYALDVRAGFFD